MATFRFEEYTKVSKRLRLLTKWPTLFSDVAAAAASDADTKLASLTRFGLKTTVINIGITHRLSEIPKVFLWSEPS